MTDNVNIKTFENFISSLEITHPEFEKFMKLGDMTALFHEESANQFIRLNYERGLLLYCLITKFRPTNVLEIGTASGFGTLCMAWAMVENNINGKIFTIDPIPITEKTKRVFNDQKGGPKIENISVKEIWEKTAKKEWIEKITTISGYSGKILNEHMLPKFDFAYIDGAHFFDAVKHDFYSFLNHANTEFGILFDDYIDRPNYGIKNLIDTDISKNFDVSLIKTDTNLHLERILSLDKHDYGMCWLDSKSLKKPLDDVYSKSIRDEYIKKYLKFENRLARRYDLNKKFPMLKNIRFKFWN